jgi:death-on-curing protein
MIYLDEEDLLLIAERATGGPVQVRDLGLLGSAAHRPRQIAFGVEPYPTLAEKAAALLCSLAMNHALIDGNKRLALAASWAMCFINYGRLPAMTNDEAYHLVMGVATGNLEVKEVTEALRAAGIP